MGLIHEYVDRTALIKRTKVGLQNLTAHANIPSFGPTTKGNLYGVEKSK